MLRLRTFGGLSLTNDGASCSGAANQRKTLALLALLASARQGISRDKLAAYLWPERNLEASRHLLKQACYALRHDLEEPELFLGSVELSLNPAVITSDIGAFEEALARHDRETAIAQYTGAFLDGFYVTGADEFERWADGERRRLATLASSAIEALATELAARGDARGVTERWRQLVALEPASAMGVLNFMTALVAGGEWAQALDVGQRYVDYVKDELDATPAPAVTDLMRQIREGGGEIKNLALRLLSPLPGPGIRGKIFNRGAITAVLVLIVLLSLVGGPDVFGPYRGEPVIVLGQIHDYSGSTQGTPAMDELLVAHLARFPVKVLNREAMQQERATDLLQGAVYRRPNGNLRLELQRIDVRSGIVQTAYAVEGKDRLALADSIAAHIAAELKH